VTRAGTSAGDHTAGDGQLETTDQALRTGGEIFGPVGAATAAVMDEFSEEELRVVVRFLDRVVATEHLAAGTDPNRSPGS